MAEPWKKYQTQQAAPQGPWSRYAKPVERTPPTGEPLADPTEGMSTTEKLRAGIGSGMVRGARGAVNLVQNTLNPMAAFFENLGAEREFMTPDWAKTEAIREQEATDKPLADTGAGATGQFIGEVAATYPMGMGTRAPSTLKAGASLLQRTLAAGAPRASLEGAASGAMYSDPEAQGTGALQGALTSVAGEKLADAGGRLVRGLVQKSDPAQRLIQQADLHGVQLDLPLSAAAREGGWSGAIKEVYDEGLSALPITGGMLRRQADEAGESFRELAMREAAPDPSKVQRGAGKNTQQTVAAIGKDLDKVYKDTIHQYAFNVPTDFAQRVEQRLRARSPNIDNVTVGQVVDTAIQHMMRFSNNGKVIDGDNLLNVKHALTQEGRMVGKKDRLVGQGLYEASEAVNDIIRDELMQGGKVSNLDDLNRYLANATPYGNYQAVKKASEKAKAKKGDFTPQQLVQSTRAPGTMRELGQEGVETLGKIPKPPSLLRRALATAAVAGGSLKAPILFPLALAASTRTGQRTLMGDTKAQRALARTLRKHEDSITTARGAVRRGVAAEAGEEDAP